MLELIRTKSFIKDMKKLRITDTQYSKFIIYIGKLLNNDDLPIESKDHPLQGEWKDTREFHLGGDLIVIYLINDNSLTLVRIGSHSQLFK